ncbi:hypothetical protein E5082_09610 [Streptomyces griseoluteus]|uniref:Uncharacterized protein n=1 Tax=Streptomyces griseoluteus TaxID=29306 RepID=A0A4Z1DLA7_STRGP|nr:hypothetical protein [Streptomyces griseoluteus]TGN84635.1 hypothetical protein E5082_09610 [Streptomyces griseoluteus]GHF00168.1 hypothetical protein GCM10017776_16490 [Streptomyces griseoluteus]
MAVKRTEYFNFDTGSVRSGKTEHAESHMDMENYLLRLDSERGATLNRWGVAVGLEVAATIGQSQVAVSVGTALDSAGHLIVLEDGGLAVVAPNADPQQPLENPAHVGPEGLTLSTTGLAQGEHVLTLTWLEGLDENRVTRLHAPWLRLLPAGGFDGGGRQVVLALVTVGADGTVEGLEGGARRVVGATGRVQLWGTTETEDDPKLGVGQMPGAELRGTDDGGLVVITSDSGGEPRSPLRVNGDGSVRVNMRADTPPMEIRSEADDGPALEVFSSGSQAGIRLDALGSDASWGMHADDDGGWRLSNLAGDTEAIAVDPDGRVAIGVDSDFHYALHVGNTGVHTSGGLSGYSFGDRGFTDFVERPSNGERWLWYAFAGAARLWSGEDFISISRGEGNALDVSRRMRVRQGGDFSAGIWFRQTELGEHDSAFIGMVNNENVGFWGNDDAGWGLAMNTKDANVTCSNGLTVVGTATVGSSLQAGGDLSCGGQLSVGGNAFFGRNFGQPNGPAVAKLFGSNVGDTGEGVLFLRSGGGVVAFNGDDLIGIGTKMPQFKLDVRGNMRVTGFIDKPGGGFRIDHPVDPANKYLSHSFVESPDMATVYSGMAETNEAGEATVVLPDYFEALNRDYRYQLTPVGSLAQVAVTGEIKDNRFTLRTDTPGIKISWQVTGVRQDAWAEAHRIPTEEDKPENERNLFLHPEEHGRPRSADLLERLEGTV